MGKKDFIHERSALVKIFEIGEDKILIEGTLTDERFCQSFIYSLEQFINLAWFIESLSE